VYGTEEDGIVYGMMIWYGTGQMLQNQRETVLTVQPCGIAHIQKHPSPVIVSR
jgi:hypothetical protein